MGLHAHRPDEITVAEAARALGISRTTVWNWVTTGKIDGRRSYLPEPDGRARWFVKLAAVEALLRRNRRVKRLLANG